MVLFINFLQFVLMIMPCNYKIWSHDAGGAKGPFPRYPPLILFPHVEHVSRLPHSVAYLMGGVPFPRIRHALFASFSKNVVIFFSVPGLTSLPSCVSIQQLLPVSPATKSIS